MTKLYGFSTIDELRSIAPLAKTLDGVRFSGDARKVGAILALAGAAEELIAERDQLLPALEKLAAEFGEQRSSGHGESYSQRELKPRLFAEVDAAIAKAKGEGE